MARVDYEQMAATYDRGRALTLDGIEPWRVALAPYLPAPGNLPVLDLGSGTGQFSAAIARWFDTPVVAVEPAAGMRREAQRKNPEARVISVGGAAERLPLRTNCCGCAWLSTVIHHIADLAACARELRRVLSPGGRVLIRSAFPGRLDRITLFRFFPEALRVAETFPTVDATVSQFASAGFALEHLEPVPQITASGLRDVVERVRMRADSTLKPLSEDAFSRGMTALEHAAAADTPPHPVVDWLDLLVLR